MKCPKCDDDKFCAVQRVIMPDNGIYFTDKITLEQALRILSDKDYTVRFLTKREKETDVANGAIVMVEPAFNPYPSKIKFFNSIDELIVFANKAEKAEVKEWL